MIRKQLIGTQSLAPSEGAGISRRRGYPRHLQLTSSGLKSGRAPIGAASCPSERQEDANKARLAIIDRRPITREAIVHLIQRSAEDFLALPFSSVEELGMGGSDSGGGGVDLILLSIGSAPLSDRDVCEDLTSLSQTTPAAPIAILSDCENPECVAEALCRGVRGYISTSFSSDVVISVLRLIMAGGAFVPVTVASKALNAMPAAKTGIVDTPSVTATERSFTPRQLEVLSRLREGKSNKLIGYELAIKESTVKVHVRHILHKLGATNRTQAAYLVQHSGSLPG